MPKYVVYGSIKYEAIVHKEIVVEAESEEEALALVENTLWLDDEITDDELRAAAQVVDIQAHEARPHEDELEPVA